MACVEIIGTIGSIIAVLEASIASGLYLKDVYKAPQEQAAMGQDLWSLDHLLLSLRRYLDDKPRCTPSAASSQVHFLNMLEGAFEGVQQCVDDIKDVLSKAKRLTWKFDKQKMRELWGKLESMKSLIMLTLSTQTEESLREYKDLATKRYESAMTTLSYLRKDVKDVRGDIAILQKHVDWEFFEAIRSWMIPNYFLEHDLKEIQAGLADRTGEWLIQSDAMAAWKAGTERVLVLTGPPGCGKTFLSYVVTDHLQNQPNQLVLPVFLKYSAKLQIVDVLSRLAVQLIEPPNTIPEALRQLHRRRTLDLDALQDIVMTELQSRSSSVTIVLDALDEFNCSPPSHLVSALLGLSPDIRLFITSRPLPTSIFSPHGFIHCPVQESDPEDLKAYVDAGVQILDCTQTPDDVVELRAKILEGSSGIFLLASLHLRELSDCLEMDSALTAAETFPTTAPDRYHRSVERIRSKGRHAMIALHTLMWVWTAKRRLTLDELRCAVASSTRNLSGRKVKPALVAGQKLLELCEGLIVEGERFVEFVHLTAKTFFDDFGTEIFDSYVKLLGPSCLGYLNANHSSFDLEFWQTSFENGDSGDPEEGLGFFDYSARYWGDHSQRVDVSSPFLALVCNEEAYALSTAIRLWHDAPPLLEYRRGHLASPLHLAASFGLHDCVACIPDSDGLPLLDTKGKTAVHYAMVFGHIDTVQELLEAPSAVAEDQYGRSLLSYAAQYGYHPVASLVLRLAPDRSDYRDNNGRSPLSYASERGHIQFVKLLLGQENVEADSRDGYGRSPLSYAALEGHVQVIQLLLDHGAEVNSRANNGRSPLSYASHWGHAEVVKCLLDYDAIEVDSRDNGGRTPLSYAAQRGHYRVTQLLLQHEKAIEIDSRDSSGRSPLLYASWCGHLNIIQLLLNQPGIDPNLRDNDGRSPLSYGSERGHPSIVLFLLTLSQVRPDSKDKAGRTPLSYAAQRADYRTVELLAGHKEVDLNSRDNLGQSPLWYASERRSSPGFKNARVILRALAERPLDSRRKLVNGYCSSGVTERRSSHSSFGPIKASFLNVLPVARRVGGNAAHVDKPLAMYSLS